MAKSNEEDFWRNCNVPGVYRVFKLLLGSPEVYWTMMSLMCHWTLIQGVQLVATYADIIDTSLVISSNRIYNIYIHSIHLSCFLNPWLINCSTKQLVWSRSLKPSHLHRTVAYDTCQIWLSKTYLRNFLQTSPADVNSGCAVHVTNAPELWWYIRKSTDISNFTEYLNRHIVT